MQYRPTYDPMEPILQANPHEQGRVAFYNSVSKIPPYDHETEAAAFWSWSEGYRLEAFREAELIAQDEPLDDLELYEKTIDERVDVEIANRHRLFWSERLKKDMPTAESVAETIAFPLPYWPGNCFGIAVAVHKAGLFPGYRPVYGEFHGPISTDSIFARRRAPHHGFLVNDRGLVIDPTRYVFEGAEPYIHIGIQDYDYDVAGERRRTMTAHLKAPAWSNDAQKISLQGSNSLALILTKLLPADQPSPLTLTVQQAFWLANLPPHRLGKDAVAIYAALDAGGAKGLVPLDFYALVDPDRYQATVMADSEAEAA